MNRSESIAQLAEALALAQSKVENATKSSVNDHFRNRYADLAEVLETVRPVFAEFGLAITQLVGFDAEQGLAVVETVLAHKSGEWISGTLAGPVVKLDPQGLGSALTYYRRYSLSAVCGISQADDDGNAASNVGAKGAAPARQAPPKATGKRETAAANEAKPAEKPDPAKLLGHIDAIKAAPNAESLRATYANAYSYAKATGDEQAKAAIVAAYETRKAEVA